VRLLSPLAQDLREWRMASGRPGDDERVIPAPGGGEWSEPGYERWIRRVWMPALADVGLTYQRPYVLRHSFALLLLHEGRSVVFVARQLGHSTMVLLRTYGHVIEELDDAPRTSAEDAILRAHRGEDVRPECVEAE
jgi:integrase